jgi:TIR domain
MPGLTELSRSWRGLLVSVAIVAAAAGAALTQPAALAGTQPALFAAFLSATLTATFLVTLLVARYRLHASTALISAAALLALGAAAYMYGDVVQGRCIVEYNGRGVVVGTELTKDVGALFRSAHPEETDADLLDNASGDAATVWTRESIEWCRSRVASTYFLWIPFLIASLVSAALGTAARRLTVPVSHTGPVTSTVASTVSDTPPLYDVFISYRQGGADAGVARQLLHALESDGYVVAIDERDFPANASFLQEMERCIRESRYTVAIVSPRYFESGHTEEEAIISKVLDMGQRRRRLIPFIIQAVAMPAWLFGIVGIDCTVADPLLDPIERLKATLGTPLAGRRPIAPPIAPTR